MTIAGPKGQKSAKGIVRKLGLSRWLNAGLAGMSLAVMFAFAVPSVGWSDTLTTFDLSSTSATGEIFSGTGYSFGAGSAITIDTTKGTVTSANITIDNSTGVVATFSGVPNILDSPDGYTWISGTSEFAITALPNAFEGFTGCSNCTGEFYKGLSLFAGSVSLTDPPPATTPEPASILLFGTSLLGLMGLTLRRKQSE
jgi:hypothetical protein